MGSMGTKEAASRWGLSERRVCELCRDGRVPGAVRVGRDWVIPGDAERPRRRNAKGPANVEERLELYLNPAWCENRGGSCCSDEETALCKASDHALKGELNEAGRLLEHLARAGADDAYLVVAQMMLYLVRTMGDPDACRAQAALAEVEKIVERNPGFHHARTLLGSVRDGKLVHPDLLGVPKRFAALFAAQACTCAIMDSLAVRSETDDCLLELLVGTIDEREQPGLALNAHAVLANYYSVRHDHAPRDYHVRKSLEIALPRKWYAPLADYSVVLDWHEAKDADPEAYGRICALSGTIMGNYVQAGRFGRALPGVASMTSDEIRVAFMSARGMNVRDIAATLEITNYRARKLLESVHDRTRTTSREGLRAVLSQQCQAI